MTTRLWMFSDLHIDAEPDVDILAGAPATWDAAVVAGDVDQPAWRAILWLAERLGGSRIVYVPGNHCRWSSQHDGTTHTDLDEHAQDLAARYGIDWLDRGSTTVGGVDVHGATLWTDLRLGYATVSQGIGAARRGMNDYRRIRRRPSGRHRHVRPEDTREWHRRDLAWLDGVLSEPRERPAVVVTHHAPSPQCLQDPYDSLGHCYASDLRGHIARWRPDLWIHGHVHHHVDVVEGATRIIANGRGRGPEVADWQPGLVVTV